MHNTAIFASYVAFFAYNNLTCYLYDFRRINTVFSVKSGQFCEKRGVFPAIFGEPEEAQETNGFLCYKVATWVIIIGYGLQTYLIVIAAAKAKISVFLHKLSVRLYVGSTRIKI